MAERDDSHTISVSEDSKSKRLSDFLTHAFSAFSDIFYNQFQSISAQVQSYSKQRERFYITLMIIFYSMQLLSLVFHLNTPNWDSYKWLSEIISITRFDYLMVSLDLGMPCYFIAVSITTIIFTSLVILIVKSFRSLGYNIENYKITFTLGLKAIKFFCFIPFLCIFIAVQKFELYGKAEQYESARTIELPIPYLGLVSIVYAMIVIFLELIHEIFTYQQFLVKSSVFIYSRAHSKVECLRVILITGLIFSYFYIEESHNTIHILISLSIGITLWFLYTYYQPFFQAYTNYLFSSAFLLLSWVSLVLLLSKLLPDSEVVFLLIIFVSPCLLILQWEIINIRKSTIRRNYPEQIKTLDNIYKFELLIRCYSEEIISLKGKEANEAQIEQLKAKIFAVFRLMKKKFKPSNIQAAWEFIFVLTICKDEGLARVKLSGNYTVFDIEGSYLYYKYCKLIDECSKNYLEEVDFVKFRKIYEIAMKQDEKTCKLQFEFWKELSAEKPNVEKLEKIAYRLHDNLKRCKKDLLKVTTLYPNNQLALKLHGTFLLEVYNDTVKGNDLLSKAEHEKKQQEMRNLQNYDKFNYFDDSNGIIIISGNRESLGNITSINHSASEVLKISTNFVLTFNIANFLPAPIDNIRTHNRALLQFLLNTETTVVGLPFVSYFVDSAGFLVEVYLHVRCVALNNNPFFLAGLKRTNLKREVILYDADTILYSTKGFAKLVGFSDSEISLKGCQLSSIIKDINIHLRNQEYCKAFQYSIPQTVNFVDMKFVDIQIKQYKFKYIIASDDQDEIRQWDVQQASRFEDLIDLRTQTIKNVVVSTNHKGILRKSAVKKGLLVKFNIAPVVIYIDETDFHAGHCPIGKGKDGSAVKAIDKQKSRPAKHIEIDKPEENADQGIMDLKDLKSDMLKQHNEEPEEDDDPGVVKRSSASVASSAQSSNASFTASIEAQSLLSGVTNSMKKFKVAFFLTILIVNAAIIAIMIYLQLVSQTYINTIIIKELSERRIIMANITTFARELELLNYKAVSYNESDIRKLMQQDILLYRNIVASIENKLNDWDHTTRKLYGEAQYKVWTLVGNLTIASEVTLIDIMKLFINNAVTLFLTDLKLIDSKNSNLYFLYRNGFAESMEAVNVSISAFTQEQEKITNWVLEIALLLAISAIVLMVLCFGLVMIPTLFAVEKSKSTVWRLFYLLPLDLVQEMRARSEERLEMTHGVEYGYFDENQKFKSINTRKNIKMQQKWQFILLRISLYYLISMGIFIFFYYFAYESFGNVLRLKPKLVNMSGLRELSTRSAYFWLQELKYSATNLSYLAEMTNFRLARSPEAEIMSALEFLGFSEDSLVFGDLSGFGKTALHNEYLWKSQCLVSNCSLLAKGLHSGVLGFSSEVLNALGSAQQGLAPDLDKLLSMKNELAYGEKLLFDMYDTSTTDSIGFYINTVIAVTISYCLIVTLTYFFIYIPMINSVKQEITKVWKLGRLIPIEHRNKIMAAFKTASGKS